ncbi:putative protein Pop3 [Platanthera guangdongensis]|uniref:Stress-response A/B barrel domain-containing protein n=1 Tax=Platanthera guangdongensis TaxID=2320717 RepID=A0ABR2LPV9_9ASPA
MEEATGVVKHVLLAKFKDDVSPEKIDEFTMEWANPVDVIEPMKDFHWYLSTRCFSRIHYFPSSSLVPCVDFFTHGNPFFLNASGNVSRFSNCE